MICATASLNNPICFCCCCCCCEFCVQRRLLAAQADLYSTITYPGTSSGGQALVTAANSNQLQIEGDVQVTVTGAAVQTVQLANLGDASIAVEQVPYVAGEPYYFTVTYKIGDTATDAAVIVTTSPAEAMYCWATDSGVGVTQFTCNPKQKLSAVQIIANGPNPKAVTTPVTASTAVYNTSELIDGYINRSLFQLGCTQCGTHHSSDQQEACVWPLLVVGLWSPGVSCTMRGTW